MHSTKLSVAALSLLLFTAPALARMPAKTAVTKTTAAATAAGTAAPSNAAAAAKKSAAMPAFLARLAEGEKQMGQAKMPGAKITLIQKMLTEMKTIRKQAVRGDESDELSMSLFMDSFNELPRPEKFRIKDCPQYRHQFVLSMKAKNPDENDPLVLRAEKFWESLCSSRIN